MSDSPAIDLRNVAKVYRGRVHALQGIALRVSRGEVFGLLGPNGAGKSTLVKIMMSVVRPTRAEGTILGNPVGHKPTLARVGYLPESHRFPRYLTGRQTLEFFGGLSKVDPRTCRARAAELLDTVGMADWGDRATSTYSKGMMQRVGLAQALMGDPDLVVLDEPTDGVDPVGRRDIRDVLGRLRARGKTVFVNSHLLGELELICDRIAILVQGKVARQGTIDELTVAKQRYEIELAGTNDPSAARAAILGALPAAPAGAAAGNGEPVAARPAEIGRPDPLPAPPPLARAMNAADVLAYRPALAGDMMLPRIVPSRIDRRTLPSGQWIELDGLTVRIGTTDPADVQPILDALRRAGLVIGRVQMVRPSLEDLFLDVVTDPVTGAAAPAGATLGNDKRVATQQVTA